MYEDKIFSELSGKAHAALAAALLRACQRYGISKEAVVELDMAAQWGLILEEIGGASNVEHLVRESVYDALDSGQGVVEPISSWGKRMGVPGRTVRSWIEKGYLQEAFRDDSDNWLIPSRTQKPVIPMGRNARKGRE